MRFGINGSRPSSNEELYVNSSKNSLTSLDGISVLSGSGTLSRLSGDTFTVLSASGKNTVKSGATSVKPTTGQSGTFVIEGSGSGHNLGMSQQGARAMAEAGYTYEDILHFYYTDITIA